jgi:hypothetical protein
MANSGSEQFWETYFTGAPARNRIERDGCGIDGDRRRIDGDHHGIDGSRRGNRSRP